MTGQNVKWNEVRSFHFSKQKKAKVSPTTKEVTCGRRVGAASKAKAHFSKQKKAKEVL